jgi:hypothetical protein
VGRAKQLLTVPKYRAATEAARTWWNELFPQFAFAKRDRDPPPDPGTWYQGPAGMPDSGLVDTSVFVPLKLVHALPMNYWRLGCLGDLGTDSGVDDAYGRWREMVVTMCRSWWPEPLYTTWCDPRFEHPAMRFVSATIIWDLNLLTDEHAEAWVEPRGSVGHQLLPFDPANRRAVTEAVYWQTFLEGILARAHTVIANKGGIGKDDLASIEEAAKADAQQRWDEVADIRWWAQPHPVLPLKRGMTAVDVEGFAQKVEDVVATFFSDRNDDIVRLRQGGVSTQAIAKLLGMSRQGVEKILRARSPDATK